MTFQDIKELVAEDGGRVIIVERDAIVAVVLSHEAYKALKKPAPSPSGVSPSEPPLQDLPDFEEPDELTIDDLPL